MEVLEGEIPELDENGESNRTPSYDAEAASHILFYQELLYRPLLNLHCQQIFCLLQSLRLFREFFLCVRSHHLYLHDFYKFCKCALPLLPLCKKDYKQLCPLHLQVCFAMFR